MIAFLLRLFGSSPYGKEKLKPYDGHGLFSQIRAVCQVKLDKVPPQRPVVKYATADRSKVRAKECKYRRWMPLRRAK